MLAVETTTAQRVSGRGSLRYLALHPVGSNMLLQIDLHKKDHGRTREGLGI